ncbi:dihydropteroate synthase [Maribacter antarcticus]|uniref:dihydropteroate synthase n=1 Tax=Maribacter antarcticus TaxID=505250 RepID=UPI00047C7C7D|nr:dihydropteroate synthase [Maribacter antarcticus]
MTINCKGELIDLKLPRVMGILNVTPDSFFDGGRFKDEKNALKQVEKMMLEGASFIDIGAYSSKPGADEVSEALELKRIIPIVELVLKYFPDVLLSIDTFRGTVARECVERGAAIVNDISAGLRDETLLDTIANLQVPYIMMHMRGTPKTMQKQTVYQHLMQDILLFFSQRLAMAREKGIHDIIIDPGFGFAKTLEQNYQLLQQLEALKVTDLPVLAGISRKSMIYKLLNSEPENALNGTTALHIVALTKGANILRVHDVKEAVECVRLHKQLTS